MSPHRHIGFSLWPRGAVTARTSSQSGTTPPESLPVCLLQLYSCARNSFISELCKFLFSIPLLILTPAQAMWCWVLLMPLLKATWPASELSDFCIKFDHVARDGDSVVGMESKAIRPSRCSCRAKRFHPAFFFCRQRAFKLPHPSSGRRLSGRPHCVGHCCPRTAAPWSSRWSPHSDRRARFQWGIWGKVRPEIRHLHHLLSSPPSRRKCSPAQQVLSYHFCYRSCQRHKEAPSQVFMGCELFLG